MSHKKEAELVVPKQGKISVEFHQDVPREWASFSRKHDSHEVGAILIGFEDDEGSNLFVTDLMVVEQTVGGCDFDLDDDAYADAMCKIVAADDGKQILGWIHKHPGTGKPSPSTTDWETQGKLSLGTSKPRAMLITNKTGDWDKLFSCLTLRLGTKLVPQLHDCKTMTEEMTHPVEWDKAIKKPSFTKFKGSKSWLKRKKHEVSIIDPTTGEALDLEDDEHWHRRFDHPKQKVWSLPLVSESGDTRDYDFSLCSLRDRAEVESIVHFLLGAYQTSENSPIDLILRVYAAKATNQWAKFTECRNYMFETLIGEQMEDTCTMGGGRGQIFQDFCEMIQVLCNTKDPIHTIASSKYPNFNPSDSLLDGLVENFKSEVDDAWAIIHIEPEKAEKLVEKTTKKVNNKKKETRQ